MKTIKLLNPSRGPEEIPFESLVSAIADGPDSAITLKYTNSSGVIEEVEVDGLWVT